MDLGDINVKKFGKKGKQGRGEEMESGLMKELIRRANGPPLKESNVESPELKQVLREHQQGANNFGQTIQLPPLSQSHWI